MSKQDPNKTQNNPQKNQTMDSTKCSKLADSNPKINLITIAENATEIFYRLRWGSQIYCPKCGSIHIYKPEAGKLHICADCDNRFSDTSGTAFHSTKLSLAKWLMAIYIFLTQSKGVSSCNLSRLIGVSQPTAWNMLMIIRTCLKIDLNLTDVGIIDEVYLGADWGKKPSKEKYKKLPPKPDNVDDSTEQIWIKHQFYRLASEDKIPILGISDYNSRSIVLEGFPSTFTRNVVRSHINANYDGVEEWVTDQSNLYKWITGDGYMHHVCDHSKGIYRSEEGYSSNRIEGAFSHLKRVWKGVYHRFSKEYAQLYLNEFCYRWNGFEDDIYKRLKGLFELMCWR